MCAARSLPKSDEPDKLPDVSTVPEIEAAIERLPSDELRALVNWIEEYAAAIGASETLFGMSDAEEEQSGAESQAR
jgi:hypothetical protein